MHEHPASAKSWAEEEVQEILKLKGVVRARLDMCMYNLTTQGADGPGLSKKPTDVMTNNSQFAQFLARRCDGSHGHIHLKGGKRASDAAVYTPEFCESIVEGFKLHGFRNPPKVRDSVRERDQLDSEAD